MPKRPGLLSRTFSFLFPPYGYIAGDPEVARQGQESAMMALGAMSGTGMDMGGGGGMPMGQTSVSGQIMGFGDSASDSEPLYGLASEQSPGGQPPVIQGGVKKGNFFKSLPGILGGARDMADNVRGILGNSPEDRQARAMEAMANKPQLLEGGMGRIPSVAPIQGPMRQGVPQFDPLSPLLSRRRMY